MITNRVLVLLRATCYIYNKFFFFEKRRRTEVSVESGPIKKRETGIVTVPSAQPITGVTIAILKRLVELDREGRIAWKNNVGELPATSRGELSVVIAYDEPNTPSAFHVTIIKGKERTFFWEIPFYQNQKNFLEKEAAVSAEELSLGMKVAQDPRYRAIPKVSLVQERELLHFLRSL